MEMRGTEMMVMDITFKGQTQQINIHFGDDPQAVAQDFVQRNGLRPASVKVIAQYIENTMNEHLAASAEMRAQSPSLDDANGVTTEQTQQAPTHLFPPPDRSGPIESTAPNEQTGLERRPASASLAQSSASTKITNSSPPFSQASASGGFDGAASSSSVYLDFSQRTDAPAMGQSHTSESSLFNPLRLLRQPSPSPPPTQEYETNASIDAYSTAFKSKTPLRESAGSRSGADDGDDDSHSRGSSATTQAINLPHVNIFHKVVSSPTRPPRAPHPHADSEDENVRSVGSRSTSTNNPNPSLTTTPNRGQLSESRNHSSRSITPDRSRTGSFALHAQPGSVSYEIRRYRSDSLSFSPSGEGRVLDTERGIDNDRDSELECSDDDDLFNGANADRRSSRGNRRSGRRQSYLVGSESDDRHTNAAQAEVEAEEEAKAESEEETVPQEQTEEEMYNFLKTTVMHSGEGAGAGAGRPPSAIFKPSSNVMMMGKHKFSSSNTASGAMNSKNMNSPSMKGKSACERLYMNANVMTKKKEFLSHQKEAKEERELVASKYKVNRNSKKILQNINQHMYSGDYDVTKKLYDEGVTARQRKLNTCATSEERRAKYVYDWSCAHCGQQDVISSNVLNHETRSSVVEKLYICKHCGFNNYDVIYSQDKKPVNIGFMYNKSIESTVDNVRMQAVGDESALEEGMAHNIHEYLYNAGRMQDKILKLNKVLYEEMQSQLTFRPQIPSSSKTLIEKSLRQEDEVKPVDEDCWSFDGPTAMSMKAGSNMKAYFSKPTTVRLSTTYTKAQTIAHEQARPAPKKALSKDLRNRHQAAIVDRLANGHKDKQIKVSLLEKENSKYDPITKQELYKPSVKTLPSDLYNAAESKCVDPATGKTIPIWEKLKLKDAKFQERRRKAEQEAVNKLLTSLQSHQVRALDSSNAILEASFERNISELYKLLLVSNMIFHNVGFPSDGQAIFSSSDTGLPDGEALYAYAQSLEDFEGRMVDLLAVDTNILINEVSTLLMDMQNVCYRRNRRIADSAKTSCQTHSALDPSVSAIQANGSLITDEVIDLSSFGAPATPFVGERGDNHDGALRVCDLLSDRAGEEMPEHLLIDFQGFVKLAKYCVKRRCGPGTGYLYAPKKKPVIALKRKEEEESQITYHPSLDRNSVEILKSTGNSRSLFLRDDDADAEEVDELTMSARQSPPAKSFPSILIEDVLLADGEKVQSKIESMRQKQIFKAAEELTFKPFLHKPPKHIQPKYRGVGGDDESNTGSTVGGSDSSSLKFPLEERFDEPRVTHFAPTQPKQSMTDRPETARPACKPMPSSKPVSSVDSLAKTQKWQTADHIRKERFLAFASMTGSTTVASECFARQHQSPTSRSVSPHAAAASSPKKSPKTPSDGNRTPFVAMEDVYNAFEFDEERSAGEDSPSMMSHATKSTISTKFTIDLPDNVDHDQHDHMFSDVMPYIAQDPPIQKPHSNCIPNPGSSLADPSSGQAPLGHTKFSRSMASFSWKNYSLSYSSCNSSMGSGGSGGGQLPGTGVRGHVSSTASNAFSSGFISAIKSDSEDSQSRSGASAGDRSRGSQNGRVVRRSITTRSSGGTKSAKPRESLPLLPEELQRMQSSHTLHSPTELSPRPPDSPGRRGLGFGLDDSSVFSISTASSTIVKQR